MEMESLIAAQAKENQQAGGGSGNSGRQKSDKPIRTDEQTAKLAGMSRDSQTRSERPGDSGALWGESRPR